MTTFTIPGRPKPKGRPRVTKWGKTYTPKDTREYEELVREICPRDEYYEKPEALELIVEAYFPIPASWPKQRQAEAAAGNLWHTIRPDGDNIAKIICDALNGVLFEDDSQIALMHVVKQYADTPRVDVMIRSIKEAEEDAKFRQQLP